MATVTLLSQNDPRWKNMLLGLSTSSTIGSFGCLLTSLTMVADAYGFTETPATLDVKMKNCAGFQDDLLIPRRLGAALPGMSVVSEMDCAHIPAPLAEIDAFLAQGNPVIVQVDSSRAPGLQSHFVALTAKSGTDYQIADPWPYPTRAQTLLKGYGFGSTDPAHVIQYVLLLKGPGASSGQPQSGPTGSGATTSGATASFPVYATADGLALRSQPLVADNTLLKRVSIGAQLLVRESDDAATAKLGQINQWLAVIDPSDGTQGFAAAWYLARDPAAAQPPDASTPITPPTSPAPGILLKTTADAVALRSAPQIADDTLIKRLAVNTQLMATVAPDQVQARLGVNGDWLPVQDVTGASGWVAAWFLALADGLSTLGPEPNGAGAAVPPPLLVRTATDGLALRSQPVIADTTLIKRLLLGADLLVLDDPTAALAKLGEPGQWLQVRDAVGVTGYAAAVYLVRAPAPVAAAPQA